MKAVLQRVSRASVTVDGDVIGQVGRGLLVLLGVEQDDALADAQQLADKSVFGSAKITMMFDPKSYDLRQWTITDAQGKDTTVMIFNVKQGVKFDPALFKINTQRLREFNQGGTQR